jgi:hypothetical protein
MPPIMLAISAKDAKNPAGYQLLEQVRAHCLKVEVEPGVFRECRPENFGVDDSGGEGGLCDIFAREWSPNIHRIQFQGSASTDSVSLEDPRPANDVYFNKRAEMYHYASTAMQYGQLKGIDEDTARELCSIEVNTGKRRISMQDKHEYRASHGNQSPDRSDSFVMLAEVARRRGFSLKPIGQTLKLVEAIDETNAKNEEVYREENMYQEETLEEMQMEPVESLYGDE